jgi:glycosyltransferase involved in cell wall biosynthesis
VVASNAASLPEVCGSAAEYVDPESTESIAGGIRRVVSSPGLQDALAQQGLQRGGCFSYADAAGQVLQILEQAVS